MDDELSPTAVLAMIFGIGIICFQWFLYFCVEPWLISTYGIPENYAEALVDYYILLPFAFMML